MNIDLITLLWVVGSTFIIYLMLKTPIKNPGKPFREKSKRYQNIFLILLSFVLACSLLGMTEIGDIILRLIYGTNFV